MNNSPCQPASCQECGDTALDGQMSSQLDLYVTIYVLSAAPAASAGQKVAGNPGSTHISSPEMYVKKY